MDDNIKLNILAVDDDEQNISVLNEILSDHYNLNTVSSGEDALTEISKEKPDLVLLDIMMPGIDGYEVCRRIRKNEDYSSIRILLLSAKTSMDDKLEGYKLGANDYITKPFNIKELQAKVNVYANLKVESAKRREYQKQLAESETRYRTILENIENGYFEVDLDGHLTFINKAFSKILGYNKDELMRMDNRPYMEKICCLNNPDLLETLKTSTQTVARVMDCELKKKDGTICYIQSSTTLAKDTKGRVLGLRGVIYDITQRKKQENQLRAANEEMQALSETGALVATVVHDAKKFTTAMSMSIEGLIMPQIKEHLSHEENWVLDLLNDIVEVHNNSVQCTQFLESLLNINRKHEKIETIDIIDIIQQALSLQSYNMMQNGIEWTFDFDQSRRLLVLGNNQLIRVFMNLIANAADALLKSESGDPKITITITDDDQKVSIFVHDNGPGIKPEVLKLIRKGIRISTKGKSGNGFGISGATRIVNQCNGSISIESQLGEGATFIVELPKSSEVTGDPELEIQLDDSIELF